MKPTICVDFDGTLCDHAYPGIGDVKPHAAYALKSFRQWGFRIIISSCRSCSWHEEIFGGGPALERERVKEMIAFLEANDIPFDEIDDGTKGKPLADYYIDDKGIRFDANWLPIMGFIFERTHYSQAI